MSVLAHSLIHSFAHSFIDQSTKQASEQATNQSINTLWDNLGHPPLRQFILSQKLEGKTLRKMMVGPFSRHSSTAVFSRFLLKRAPDFSTMSDHHVVFFQLIEAIFQLQTLEKQEAHLLFNITSPGVPCLHIDDFKNAFFRKDFWIFRCFWKRAFLKRTFLSFFIVFPFTRWLWQYFCLTLFQRQV